MSTIELSKISLLPQQRKKQRYFGVNATDAQIPRKPLIFMPARFQFLFGLSRQIVAMLKVHGVLRL
jgi:hypothetical protein